MAIRHKRKATSGYTWQTNDLVEGQIGLNIADGTAHIRKSNGSIVTLGSAFDYTQADGGTAYASFLLQANLNGGNAISN